jgi:Adenine-specific DNA methylase
MADNKLSAFPQSDCNFSSEAFGIEVLIDRQSCHKGNFIPEIGENLENSKYIGGGKKQNYKISRINNRRYLGNKYKLLPFIKKIVCAECKDVKIVADIFSGTGAVSSIFLDKTLITNDIMYSNYICNYAWFGAESYSTDKIIKHVVDYNYLEIDEENYMTKNFSDTFFSHKVCSKIGFKRYVGPDDGLLGKNQYNNHWNQDKPDGRQVCVHGFIGKLADGSIATYQTLPWNYRGWHAGGSANDTHIGFEICEDGLTDASYFSAVYKEAVELCIYLCKQYGLTEKNIICHSEGYKLGIASNHGDVMHWFPKHGKSMDTFRAAVKVGLAATEAPVPVTPTTPKKYYRVQVGAYSVKSNADAMLAKIKAAGFTDAFVKYSE